MKCCRNCRSPYGTCLTNHQCRCHRIDDYSGNTTTYRDPTADQAIANLSRKQRRRNRRQK